jgi:hypothetical protein
MAPFACAALSGQAPTPAGAHHLWCAGLTANARAKRQSSCHDAASPPSRGPKSGPRFGRLRRLPLPFRHTLQRVGSGTGSPLRAPPLPDAVQPPSNIVIPGPSKYVLLLTVCLIADLLSIPTGGRYPPLNLLQRPQHSGRPGTSRRSAELIRQFKRHLDGNNAGARQAPPDIAQAPRRVSAVPSVPKPPRSKPSTTSSIGSPSAGQW